MKGPRRLWVLLFTAQRGPAHVRIDVELREPDPTAL